MNSNFVTVDCPSCKQSLQINNDHISASFKCSHCGNGHLIIRENGKIVALNPPDKMQSLVFHIMRVMPLEIWGFTQSANYFAKFSPNSISHQSGNRNIPTVIYNSEKCRVMFQIEDSGIGRNDGSFIYYGRSHAPNDMPIMKWNNENCYCWHNILDIPLSFLDGLSPSAAANRSGSQWRELINSLRASSEFTNSSTEHIRYPLKLHAAIWNKYGNVLFNLFDLRKTELWVQYTQYLKECYDIRGRSSHYSPEFDKVC
jgi:ribosomal protein S27E